MCSIIILHFLRSDEGSVVPLCNCILCCAHRFGTEITTPPNQPGLPDSSRPRALFCDLFSGRRSASFWRTSFTSCGRARRVIFSVLLASASSSLCFVVYIVRCLRSEWKEATTWSHDGSLCHSRSLGQVNLVRRLSETDFIISMAAASTHTHDRTRVDHADPTKPS